MLLPQDRRDDLAVVGTSLVLAIVMGLCGVAGVAVALSTALTPLLFSVVAGRAAGRAGACGSIILAFGSLMIGLEGTRLGVVNALVLAAMAATSLVVSARFQATSAEVESPATGYWMTVEVESRPALQVKPTPSTSQRASRFRRPEPVKVVTRRA